MRTTLTLDDDVATMLEERARVERKTLKQVVNEALRRGLSPGSRPRKKRYDVEPHPTRLQPGIDPSGFNRLAEELEDDAVIERVRHGS